MKTGKSGPGKVSSEVRGRMKEALDSSRWEIRRKPKVISIN